MTFDDFLHCPDNPANNRQVWMLSDLKAIGCDLGKVQRRPGINDRIENNTLLLSAMRNLREMPFFGLLEYPYETDVLFEQSFGVKFISNFAIKDVPMPLKLTAEQSEFIVDHNRLDIALYQFAKALFLERYNNVTKHTNAFQNKT